MVGVAPLRAFRSLPEPWERLERQNEAALGRVRKSVSRPEAHKIRIAMDKERRRAAAAGKRKATARRKKAPKRQRVVTATATATAPVTNPALASSESSTSSSTRVSGAQSRGSCESGQSNAAARLGA